MKPSTEKEAIKEAYERGKRAAYEDVYETGMAFCNDLGNHVLVRRAIQTFVERFKP